MSPIDKQLEEMIAQASKALRKMTDKAIIDGLLGTSEPVSSFGVSARNILTTSDPIEATLLDNEEDNMRDKRRRAYYDGVNIAPLENTFPELIWVIDHDNNQAIGLEVGSMTQVSHIRRGHDALWCENCEVPHGAEHLEQVD